MTTTAYDTHFIASDIAFTDEQGDIHLNIPFRKVKRIGGAVIGMAGCLDCMRDFSQMVLDFVLQEDGYFEIPESIINRQDKDFIAMIYINGSCLKVAKLKSSVVQMDNITQIPTVIGSGSSYVQGMLNDCPNAVVAVLEAIKHDKYTDGDVKYCSIRRDDIHNLEAHPMSTRLNTQITGLQQELTDTDSFLQAAENEGKAFHASTEVYHLGSPASISVEAGMVFLKQGFASIRATLVADDLSHKI